MSPIGRIFIVLNLILAAGFLAAASTLVAEGESWKEKHETAVADATAKQADLEGQLSALRVENDTKSAEASEARSTRDNTKADNDRLEGLNKDLNQQLLSANATNTKNSDEISKIQSTLSDVVSTKDQAVEARRTAENERDDAMSTAQDANTKSEDLAAQNSDLNGEIAALKDQLAMASKANSSLETQLATLVDVTGVSMDEITTTRLIEASVLQAVYDVQPGLVALNKGSNDGVERGYTFEVYNGGSYKGQVRVENVHEGMCTAIILRVEDGQTIGSGDKASTRL